MPSKNILIVLTLVAVLATAVGYAQQPQSDRSQTNLRQDGRYLVYMLGIT